jgi:signal peptidase
MQIALKRVKTVSSYMMFSLVTLVFAFMALMLISKVVMKQDVPRIAGFSSFMISSGSMRGDVDQWSKDYSNHINPGDIVITHQTNDLEVGDVITFFVSESEIVTHRIVAINDDGYITTRGDANNVVDRSSVNKVNVIGKVALTIPKLGYVSMYLKNFVIILKTNILLDIGLAAVLCGVAFLVILARKEKTRA